MAEKAYAKRYAQAVFQIALEKNEPDRWQSDLEKIAVLGEDAEFVGMLENPKVPFDEKKKIIAGQFSDVNPLALNLVYLLLQRENLGLIGEVAGEYRQLYNAYRGIDQALVTTAVPLEEDERKKLEGRLGALVGKKVEIESEVDESLMGGITARIGGKLIDGSTRTRLENLKEQIGRRRR